MNHTPAQILATLINEDSAALLTNPTDGLDWPLYVSMLPDTKGTPANAAGITDTTGREMARMLDTGVSVWEFAFQLRIRATGYVDAWQKSKALSDFLSLVHNAVVELDDDTYEVEAISQTAPPIFTGRDELGRVVFSLNGYVTIGILT